jgi:magnesium-transporting ATPase (P-type)
LSEIDGLAPNEVLTRTRAGQTNEVTERTSRTIGEIVRGNVFTRFNGILGALFCVMLLVGSVRDALFGGVLVANALIGIVQELRAKRVLDRLTVLSAPKARVVRSGLPLEIPVAAVVLDDVIDIAAGDQVVADGTVLTSEGLEVDESLVSGEAAPVLKPRGASLLSGSFVAAGYGRYRATAVGAAAYAHQLAHEARRYAPAHSELQAGINQILRLITWGLIPMGALLVASQLDAQGALSKALQSTVAGLVPMVPEGLVLLTSLALATAVTRLGRRSVLLQELPAVEALARADVVCLDKTGTLTEGELSVDALEALGNASLIENALGALAAIDPKPNASLRAIAARFPVPQDWRSISDVPFSSARKWSGATFDDQGSWILGAPDVLLSGQAVTSDLLSRVAAHAEAGKRILLLARTHRSFAANELPSDLQPAAIVILAEPVRADASETLRFLAEQDITLKVISGDHPQTVASITRRAGLRDPGLPVDARELPRDQASLAALVETRTVFGRASPQDKVSIIKALRERGHVVAMIGDGVNDVLALKEADVGIAMGSGTSVTRGVAQLVLLASQFSALPSVLSEGRRVIANVERLAALFVTKTVYAFLLALAVGIADLVFPFLPRHLTLIGALTIGVPAFFLSLAPNAARARPGFVIRVLRFAIPAGTLAFAATFAAYLFVGGPLEATFEQARTAATLVLLLLGLWVLVILSRPLTVLRGALVAAMAAAFAVVQFFLPLRAFFALEPLPAGMLVASVMIAGAAGFGLELVALLIRIAGTRADWLSQQLLALLDPQRKEARSLAVLGLLVAGALLVFFGVLEDVITGDPLVRADAALFHLLQSLRTAPLDRVMVVITELGDGAVTTTVTAVAFFWFIWRRAWRSALYWIATVSAASLFTFVLKVILRLARPTDIYFGWDAFSFPSGHAAVNAALYGFLAMLIAREIRPSRRIWIFAVAVLFVSSIAFSRLYLGAHWLSDVVAGISFSVAWVALLSVAYLRHNPPAGHARYLSGAIAFTIAVTGVWHINRQYNADMMRYAVRSEIRSMALGDWWRDDWAELPVRRIDLTGELEEPFTVQWVGDLDGLTTQLLSKGWQIPVPWSRRSGFAWLTPQAKIEELPVTPRLQNGYRERLTLVHAGDNKEPAVRFVLRLWRSDIEVTDVQGAVRPLWIGTVLEERMEVFGDIMTVTRSEMDFNAPRDLVVSALTSSRLASRRKAAALIGWDGLVLLAVDPTLSPPLQ